MRTKKRNKRRMRIAIRVLMILLVVGSLVGLWKATYYWPDQRVKDDQVISELEDKNPEDYKNIKAMFAEEIESRTGKNVENVVFYVSAFDSHWDYTARVYYKTDDGWYTYTADEFSRRINTELENKLINLLIG